MDYQERVQTKYSFTKENNCTLSGKNPDRPNKGLFTFESLMHSVDVGKLTKNTLFL